MVGLYAGAGLVLAIGCGRGARSRAPMSPSAGNRPALGIHAKSAAGTGGYRPGSPGPLDAGTRRRWSLKRQAERLLPDKETKINREGAAVAHFEYRVAMCHRGSDGGPIALYRSPDSKNARFSGLQTCGSVWHCPVCSPKISRTRVAEINRAIAAWLGPQSWAGDRHVYLGTFTTQHSAADAGAGELGAILPRVAKALSKLKGSRAYRALMERARAAGAIRALEVTFGELNGWHVHTHELLFAARDGVLARDGSRLVAWRSPVYRGIRRLWAETLIAHELAGLRPGDVGLDRFRKLRNLLRHCFTLQPGAYAADYVAKYGREPESDRGTWGLGSELAKAHLKRVAGADDGRPQRCAHASPWSLLNDALDGDARSGELFREFALAFHGRRQLYWSPGLKAELGIAELDDEEIARDPEADCTEKVIELGFEAWRLVIAHEARFDVLKAAADDGRAGVEATARRAPSSAAALLGRLYDRRPGAAH
jgi:hypothetical protein